MKSGFGENLSLVFDGASSVYHCSAHTQSQKLNIVYLYSKNGRNLVVFWRIFSEKVCATGYWEITKMTIKWLIETKLADLFCIFRNDRHFCAVSHDKHGNQISYFFLSTPANGPNKLELLQTKLAGFLCIFRNDVLVKTSDQFHVGMWDELWRGGATIFFSSKMFLKHQMAVWMQNESLAVLVQRDFLRMIIFWGGRVCQLLISTATKCHVANCKWLIFIFAWIFKTTQQQS